MNVTLPIFFEGITRLFHLPNEKEKEEKKRKNISILSGLI